MEDHQRASRLINMWNVISPTSAQNMHTHSYLAHHTNKNKTLITGTNTHELNLIHNGNKSLLIMLPIDTHVHMHIHSPIFFNGH